MTDESPNKARIQAGHTDDLVNLLYDGALAEVREQDEKREYAEKIRRLLQEGKIQSSGTQELRAERIKDPDYAVEMENNRELVLRAEEVARRVYAAMHKGGQLMVKDLTELSCDLRRNGALFERYDSELTRQKIPQLDKYVFVRSGASVHIPEEAEWTEFMWGAEMRTTLASEDPKAPLITDIPDPSDPQAVFYAFREGKNSDHSKKLAESIRKNPTQIAVIDDVYTYEALLRKHGVASKARQCTDQIIGQEINPARNMQSQIRYYIANMFRLEGIRFEHEGVIHDFERSIANENSIAMHARSVHFDPTYAWALPAKPIKTSFVPEGSTEDDRITAELFTGWETVVLDRDGRR